MKKLVLVFSLVCAANIAAKEIVVERPPFYVRSTPSELDKVVLSDTATVLYFTHRANPQLWWRYSSGTYIKANGKNYTVRRAAGIELDKEVYAEKTEFSLIFPPIDPKTPRIDFLECDNPDCFKILGIELQSDTISAKSSIPAAVRSYKPDINDKTPLLPPELKYGTAVLKGKIEGYLPELKNDINEIYLNNLLLSEQQTFEFEIQNDGSFSVSVPLPFTMEVGLIINRLVNQTVLLSPNEETRIYIDLPQKFRAESTVRKDYLPNAQWVFFDGANADLNQQDWQTMNNYLKQFFNFSTIMKDIAEMSVAEYKKYILEETDRAIAGLQNLKISTKARQLVDIEIKNQAIYYLTMADHFLPEAYKGVRGLKYDDPLPADYKQPVFTPDYYDFLKNFDANNPINLYSSQFSSTVNNCKYINYRLDNTSTRHYNTAAFLPIMIKNGDIQGEDLATAQKIINNQPENWNKEKIEDTKKFWQQYIKILSTKVKLTKENKADIKKINQWLKAKENPFIEENNPMGWLLTDLIATRKVLTMEQLDLLNKTMEAKSGFKDENEIPIETQQAFWEKYNDNVSEQIAQQELENRLKTLADILGTDKGILFDAIKLQTISRSFEEFTPLTNRQFAEIAAMNNPFYLEFFTQKNNDLLAEIEAKKQKGNYNVYAAPETEDEQLLHDLLKPFEGKVILVDFWATWCGPCRSAHKQFHASKEQLKEKGVVFVYLTDESSPLNAWNNMIPDISGEHYRLKNSQFAYLRKKFGANGVPSYLIIGKNGEQSYFQVGFNQQEIERTLEKELGR